MYRKYGMQIIFENENIAYIWMVEQDRVTNARGSTP